MKFANKMKLVPYNPEQTPSFMTGRDRATAAEAGMVGRGFPTTAIEALPPAEPLLQQLHELDRQMKAILQDSDMSVEQKMTEYEQTLLKYNRYLHQYKSRQMATPTLGASLPAAAAATPLLPTLLNTPSTISFTPHPAINRPADQPATATAPATSPYFTPLAAAATHAAAAAAAAPKTPKNKSKKQTKDTTKPPGYYTRATKYNKRNVTPRPASDGTPTSWTPWTPRRPNKARAKNKN